MIIHCKTLSLTCLASLVIISPDNNLQNAELNVKFQPSDSRITQLALKKWFRSAARTEDVRGHHVDNVLNDPVDEAVAGIVGIVDDLQERLPFRLTGLSAWRVKKKTHKVGEIQNSEYLRAWRD